MNKFTIPREEWLRGEGSWASKLWDADQSKGCCVGHYAHACGVSRDTFGYTAALDPLVKINKLDPKLFPILENKTCLGSLYHVNDDTSLTDEAREAQIKELFAEADIEVTFI